MNESRKKVVLYNTNISAMLAGNEQYLKKLRHVLSIFRERNDVVLWWRPHPLNEATFASMRPQLLGEYEQIIVDYKNEGWGIYDDSPDLHRAIAMSDAYYGDGSSIVALYGITGKPVMIQSINEFDQDLSEYSIATENLYDDGEYLWFTAVDFNALFRMDKNTWKPEYMGSFPGVSIDTKRACTRTTYNNGKLYFTPYYQKTFFAYDLRKLEFEILPLSIQFEEFATGHFYYIVSYNQYVYYVGYSYKGILQYDTETGEVKCYDGWVNSVNKLIGTFEKYYFAYVTIVGNKIYCPCLLAKAILIFDMATCEYELIELNAKTNGFRSIAYDGTSFWLASQFDSKHIIKWDGKTGFVEEIENPTNLHDGLWDVISVNGSIYYLPYSSNSSLRIIFGKISTFDEFSNMFQTKNILDWSVNTVIGSIVYLHKNRPIGNSLISFDTAKNEFQEKHLLLDNEQCEKIELLFKDAFKNKSKIDNNFNDYILNESFVITLNAYLDHIVNDNDDEKAQTIRKKQSAMFKQNTMNADGTAGQAIYQYVKNIALR